VLKEIQVRDFKVIHGGCVDMAPENILPAWADDLEIKTSRHPPVDATHRIAAIEVGGGRREVFRPFADTHNRHGRARQFELFSPKPRYDLRQR
jgi:hypothetical protein